MQWCEGVNVELIFTKYLHLSLRDFTQRQIVRCHDTLLPPTFLLLADHFQVSCLLAGYGRREAVEILLNAGANVHARDDGGLIPLHNACSFGHAEVVSLLLRAGAEPNARDNWSYTPLHEGGNIMDTIADIFYLF